MPMSQAPRAAHRRGHRAGQPDLRRRLPALHRRRWQGHHRAWSSPLPPAGARAACRADPAWFQGYSPGPPHGLPANHCRARNGHAGCNRLVEADRIAPGRGAGHHRQIPRRPWPLPDRWPRRDRQQQCRTPHPPHRPGPQERPLRRPRRQSKTNNPLPWNDPRHSAIGTAVTLSSAADGGPAPQTPRGISTGLKDLDLHSGENTPGSSRGGAPRQSTPVTGRNAKAKRKRLAAAAAQLLHRPRRRVSLAAWRARLARSRACWAC